jgi:ABC-type uncharacterized transport system auxiliary subunit
MNPREEKQRISGGGGIFKGWPLFLLFILVLFLVPLSGCPNFQKPARHVEQYTLEYPPPEMAGAPLAKASLKVERFAENAAFNTSAMIYRPGPFKLDAYQYHRWRVHPADMVGDYLLRDLRKSALFGAVFSHLEPEEGRFVLQGGVEEFLETEEENRRQAVLTLSVALLDSSAKNLPERILFQKRYRFQEPLEEKSPRELAKGLSQAARKCSEALIRDVHEAIRRLGQ